MRGEGRARVLVVGPGAIGTVIATRLAARGHPVTVACRTDETARLVADRGLAATDAAGRTVHARVATVVSPEELLDEPDLAVVATKCHDAPGALREWAPAIPLERPIVAMQNGLMGDTLAPLAPAQLVESVVSFPATLEAPGRSVQTGPGGLLLGAWPHPGVPQTPAPHISGAVIVLGAAAPTRLAPNIVGAKWTKLIINSCISTLGAATGETLGHLLKRRVARDAFLAVATEGHRVGRSAGVAFEPIAGFRPGTFALSPGAGGAARAWRHILLRALGRRHRRQRSSSLQSLERGQRTEVDHLNGAIVAVGRRQNVPTPVNEALVALVHDVEAGRRKPAPEALDELPLR